MSQQWWGVDIFLSGRIVGHAQVMAADPVAAEDHVSEMIKLEAKKAYRKGEENAEGPLPEAQEQPAAN